VAAAAGHRAALQRRRGALFVAAGAGLVVGVDERITTDDVDPSCEPRIEDAVDEGVAGGAPLPLECRGVTGMVELDRRPLHSTERSRKHHHHGRGRDRSQGRRRGRSARTVRRSHHQRRAEEDQLGSRACHAVIPHAFGISMVFTSSSLINETWAPSS
jgi:hypothetical protein